ncbi:hypothetical protein ACQBAU_01570 [Propionibacteriaceae bacterium Y2011]
MSQMGDQLRPHLPEGFAVPEELERAWTWMEEQGWGQTNAHGYFLTPYAGELQLGIVFTPDATLEGLVESDTPGADQLVAIAEIAGDGSTGALWRNDAGAVRFVGLGSEGEYFLLADSAVEFLQLIAIGYRDLSTYVLGLPPEDDEAVEGHAAFREWVTETFGVEVPDEWPAVGSDEFTAWMEAKLGIEPEPTPDPPTGGATDVAGGVEVVLAALGAGDRDRAVLDLVQAAGITPDPEELAAGGVRRLAKQLRSVGVEIDVERGKVDTIFIKVERGGSTITDPASLLTGVDAPGSRERVAELLGPVERAGETWDRYVVGGRYLHFTFEADGLTKVVAMLSAP